MDNNEKFIQRLSTWWKENSPGIQPIAAGELAPGIVCLSDLHQDAGKSIRREVDIFFDLNRYRFKHEAIWTDSGIQNQKRKEARLGYLPGAGFNPPLRTPDQAYQAALEHIELRSGEEIVWSTFRLAEEFEKKLLPS